MVAWRGKVPQAPGIAGVPFMGFKGRSCLVTKQLNEVPFVVVLLTCNLCAACVPSRDAPDCNHTHLQVCIGAG